MRFRVTSFVAPVLATLWPLVAEGQIAVASNDNKAVLGYPFF